MTAADAASAAHALFLKACWLDVAVRKPGNVSLASPGHGMDAAMFVASAQAAATPLFAVGAPVGERIEAAVAASWEAAGCNTNLGIVLLCAPLAVACERAAERGVRLNDATETVLAELGIADARAAYRAIAMANPGGLGRAEAEDVQGSPSVNLREAMALAADRDLIARQYRDGFSEVFAFSVSGLPSVFSLKGTSIGEPADADTTAAVQRLCIGLLASLPDSHIVRKHGEAVAQNVMAAAQGFHAGEGDHATLATDRSFTVWDESLKAARINPGTTADLTVACLFASGLAAMLREGGPVDGTDRDTARPTLID